MRPTREKCFSQRLLSERSTFFQKAAGGDRSCIRSTGLVTQMEVKLFQKSPSAGADRLDTECSCRWVTCIHRRRVASMLLAVSPLLPWWHVNQMSIRCQSKPNVQLSPEQHHQRLSACKKLTIPTVFWSIISNNRCILWYIFFLGEWKPPELQQQVLLSLIIFTIKCENRHKAQNKSSLCFLVSSKQSKKTPKIFIYVIIDKENHKILNILSFVILKVSVRIVIAKINKILTESSRQLTLNVTILSSSINMYAALLILRGPIDLLKKK